MVMDGMTGRWAMIQGEAPLEAATGVFDLAEGEVRRAGEAGRLGGYLQVAEHEVELRFDRSPLRGSRGGPLDMVLRTIGNGPRDRRKLNATTQIMEAFEPAAAIDADNDDDEEEPDAETWLFVDGCTFVRLPVEA